MVQIPCWFQPEVISSTMAKLEIAKISNCNYNLSIWNGNILPLKFISQFNSQWINISRWCPNGKIFHCRWYFLTFANHIVFRNFKFCHNKRNHINQVKKWPKFRLNFVGVQLHSWLSPWGVRNLLKIYPRLHYFWLKYVKSLFRCWKRGILIGFSTEIMHIRY